MYELYNVCYMIVLKFNLKYRAGGGGKWLYYLTLLKKKNIKHL